METDSTHFLRQSQGMKSTGNKLAILAILFLGLSLRIYHLSNESIWYDEAFSIKLANSSLFRVIIGSVRDTNPPLYNMLLHDWINLFGNSEFSVRFLSVIFGFFAIFMIYKVGSLIFDKEVGIISSLILGLSVFHIYYSQEARMYSLMVLLTLLSIYFFIRLFKERSLIVVGGYILFSTLLIYTHVFGLFILLAQNIYVITLFLLSKRNYKPDFKKWVFLQLILLVLFTPGIMILIYQILHSLGKVSWIPNPSILTLISPFRLYAGSKLLLVLFMILSLFSIVTYRRVRGSINRKDYQWGINFSNAGSIYLLLVWLLTPIILPFIISKFSTPIYLNRYTLGASLAFYLLVAAGIRNIGYKYVKLAIIGIIIVFSLLNISRYYTTIKKEQWRDVANYIDTNAELGDLLIFCKAAQQTPFDYYSKRTDLGKRGFPEKGWEDVDEENIKELGPTVRGYNRAWIILSLHGGDPKWLIKKTLSESYNLAYSNKYLGIEVDLFEKKMKYNSTSILGA